MKKTRMSPSKIIFWVIVISILVCSSVLIYELQREGIGRNKYIALAKVIPSQQDRWLSLFLFHEIDTLFCGQAMDIVENPETGKIWKVVLKEVPEQKRQKVAERLSAVFNVLFSFGFYGERRSHNEKDVYFLFRDLMPWFILEIYFQPHYQVAIIIDDVGYNRTDAELFLNLPQKITYSIFPHLPLSQSLGEKFHEQGKEVLIHLPMEAIDDGQNHQETLLLKSGASENQIREIIKKAIATIPSARGLNNHKGSKATQDAKLMNRLMVVLKENNLLFLDSVTHCQSQAFKVAREVGLPSYRRDIFLDGEASVEYVKRKLQETVNLAKKRGYAIAIGHVKPATYEALSSFFQSFNDPEVEFVFLSDLTATVEKTFKEISQ